MALTLEELFNLQRFAPITRPNPQNQGEYFHFIEQGPPSISDIQAAMRSSNPYASLMGLTPQQRIAGSSGGFDPSIYKKLPGLLTQPATGTSTVGGSGGGGGNVVVGGGGGSGGGNLGVGPGQGVSSDTQQTALSLISLADKYPAILPGGILVKLLGLLGGLTADSQTAKMAEAQKAIEAIDKQNAAALEGGSSRTFDPYSGTKSVLSVSDKEGNVRSFDPYAGDSAKDADRAAALAESRLSVAELNKISDDKFIKNINELSNLAASNRATNAAIGLLGVDPQTGLAPGELGGRTAPIGEVPSLPLDNLGDRPESNPIASLPTLGYTGTPLGLLGDFLGGSAISLNAAPVETKEATPNPYARDAENAAAAREAQAFQAAQQAYAEQQAQAQQQAQMQFQAQERAAQAQQQAAQAQEGREAANRDRQVQAQRAADAAMAQMGRDARIDAASRAAANTSGGGGYGSGGGEGGSQPGGSGTGQGGYGPQYRGGLITPRDVKGPNPRGPDDGQASLDIGEYVIRKSAVQKYGANIFEKINAGKIPARRLKSLLE